MWWLALMSHTGACARPARIRNKPWVIFVLPGILPPDHVCAPRPHKSMTGMLLALAYPRMRRLKRPAIRISQVFSSVSSDPVRARHHINNRPIAHRFSGGIARSLAFPATSGAGTQSQYQASRARIAEIAIGVLGLIEDEVTREKLASGLPIFGAAFPPSGSASGIYAPPRP